MVFTQQIMVSKSTLAWYSNNAANYPINESPKILVSVPTLMTCMVGDGLVGHMRENVYKGHKLCITFTILTFES